MNGVVLLRGTPCQSFAGEACCAVCVAGAFVLHLLRIRAQRTRHHDVFGWVAVDEASGDDLIRRNIVHDPLVESHHDVVRGVRVRHRELVAKDIRAEPATAV